MPHDVKANASKRSWLDFEAHEYSRNVNRWRYANDHYTGELLDDGALEHYLVRRTQGESLLAFEERKQNADYSNHFATVVDSLAGMLFNVEGDATRVYADENGNGLGDPEDRDTPIGRLWDDADGRGTGWLTLWKLAATDLIVTHKLWVLVDGNIPGNSQVRLIPATSVPNWRWNEGVLSEVVVQERVDSRGSIQDEPKQVEQWVVFRIDGWERWRKDAKGEPELLDEGRYSFNDRTGMPALPIFPVKLPIRRMVGWLLARKANAIFNRESDRDHLLRVANFPKLNVVAEDNAFKAIKAELNKGSNLLQNDPKATAQHGFIAPDSGPATVATEVLNRKVEEFYITAFREYGDAAREKTATEVRQDVASGVGAFLQLLKAAVDDAENGALWRVEQIEFPNEAGRHFTAHVERTDDFLPLDMDAVIDKLRARYFGSDKPIPTGHQARVQVVRKILAMDGFQVEDAEVDAAVSAEAWLRADAALRNLPVPAEMKAQILIMLAAANNFIPPDAVVDTETAGGGAQQTSLIEVIRRRAEELAGQEEQARALAAERFGM